MIIDISMPVQPGMPIWEGIEPSRLEWTLRMERGDAVNNSRIEMDLHSGTHIDAPLHFMQDGYSADMLPLQAFCGAVFVAGVPGVKHIGEREIEALKLPSHVERVLFKTDNSRRRLYEKPEFHTDFTALTPSGARSLLKRGTRLVGIDYLSIAPYGDAKETHEVLLSEGIIVLEGLCLHDVEPGFYELICLPIRLVGTEATPVRAILKPKANQVG
ncbi:MAG: hypothetical protein A2X46_15965 [Lentisphaerae bacterium GWF2_57_35]|nr:MAG: hypothetical protein A2X46_15965 [Lentisphaerae bacterium GWF2_57_35]